MSRDEHVIVGIAWYRKDQWSTLCAICSDPEVLEETHDEWLQVAEARVRDLVESGYVVEKVAVDLDDLTRWCVDRGDPINASARSQYVAHILRREHTHN